MDTNRDRECTRIDPPTQSLRRDRQRTTNESAFAKPPARQAADGRRGRARNSRERAQKTQKKKTKKKSAQRQTANETRRGRPTQRDKRSLRDALRRARHT